MTIRRNDRPAELQDRDRVARPRSVREVVAANPMPDHAEEYRRARLAEIKPEQTFRLLTSALCFAFASGVTTTVMVLDAAPWVQVTCGLALCALGVCFVVRTGQHGTPRTLRGQDVGRETLGAR